MNKLTPEQAKQLYKVKLNGYSHDTGEKAPLVCYLTKEQAKKYFNIELNTRTATTLFEEQNRTLNMRTVECPFS